MYRVPNYAHIALSLSEEHRSNLTKLADYLTHRVSRENFDMRVFLLSKQCKSALPSGTKTLMNECGTVACAAGHGPMAGIEPLPEENWSEYITRVFGVNPAGTRVMDRLYDWCFSPSWEHVDNTPGGAAIRIRYALEHGLPSTSVDDPRFDQGVYKAMLFMCQQ